MTVTQIEIIFNQAIQTMAVDKKLEGISKDVTYNWRKGRGAKPNIGQMLGVLYQLNKISINEFNPIP